ncbi:NADP-dependent phosphogluconate dehydrogenase [Shewanella sp. C32]|uniref:6-phosphogluconate dehydrogenase, decarboxylating n=1 Tax=Shewanella electrica TaxID=515560 RepID=A0ABT2FJ94_9GAMM|nr:NADP-dependent phosphogluconate dehydrogenase [Shewanella electrica]MCH1924506.1 NADP-dependent phosphogluconate dehydrogenase [Shewanella electrica]MCS4556407.1 NADP-dependent phosphogluconate dehydrogenase [Shewanella electrica]
MEPELKAADIGVIGLGVMGKNLALNIVDNGFSVAAFDLDEQKVQAAEQQAASEVTGREQRLFGVNSLAKILASVKAPRVFLLSVPAGKAVDSICDALIEAGAIAEDIVIDTGNSLWTDTVAREKHYQGKLTFFSSAVSGGEVGARFGPSLMPSGDRAAWDRIAPIFTAIAAKVDGATGQPLERHQPGEVIEQGEPCTAYIGPAGSGHYVKMVHNGIEYADMQLICETFHFMQIGLGMSTVQIAEVFERWNKGVLNSYLIEISAEVLRQVDPQTNKPLVDIILDKAGQKGTGLWTAVSSLQLGCPASTIAEAVYARSMSTQKTLRQQLATSLQGPSIAPVSADEQQQTIDALEAALYCAKVTAYAQGFQMIAMQAKEQHWELDYAAIARIWRAGCIIRAGFLSTISDAFEANDHLSNLLLADGFASKLNELQGQWRQVVAKAVVNGIPVPCISSALAYFDSLRCEVLPANLLQGQRDYFGSHTFERTDAPAGEFYHITWSESPRKLVKIG